LSHHPAGCGNCRHREKAGIGVSGGLIVVPPPHPPGPSPSPSGRLRRWVGACTACAVAAAAQDGEGSSLVPAGTHWINMVCCEITADVCWSLPAWAPVTMLCSPCRDCCCSSLSFGCGVGAALPLGLVACPLEGAGAGGAAGGGAECAAVQAGLECHVRDRRSWCGGERWARVAAPAWTGLRWRVSGVRRAGRRWPAGCGRGRACRSRARWGRRGTGRCGCAACGCWARALAALGTPRA